MTKASHVCAPATPSTVSCRAAGKPRTAAQRREEVRRGMIESMKVLDGSLTSSVAMVTGLSAERIDALGGVGDWED